MRHLLILLLLLSACTSPAADSNETEDSSALENAEDLSEDQISDVEDSDEAPFEGYEAILQNPIWSEVPELAECREILLSQEGSLVQEPTRTTSSSDNVIEVPCGPAPGTGAYGYPMSLVVEWEAVDNSPEGTMPHQYVPIVFHEPNQDGLFEPVGYVTQAISYWDEDDLSQGYVHLLYKYAGAGHCGMFVTYSSEAWRTPYEFREARERTCDAEPCEDGSCYEPANWDLVYSTWE